MRKVALHSIFILLLAPISFNSVIAQYDTTWIKTYGGNRNDKAMDMIRTPDLGFLIIGATSSFGFDNSQMYFLKLDSIGDIMWSKSHGRDGQEWGTSVIRTSDGGYLGVGYTNSWGISGFDIFIVKLDSNGNLEYEKVKGGPDWDFAWDVVEVAPGEYVIAAETQSYGNGETDAWLLKYNENTDTFDWETTIGTSGYENFKAVALGANGNLVAAGIGKNPSRTDNDVMLTMFNSSGVPQWTKFYGDTLQDYANDIVYMSNGNYSITGLYTPSATPLTERTNILQVTDTGAVRYQHTWGGGFANAVGNRIMETDSLRIAVVSTYEVQSGNTDVGIAYSIPNAEWYQQGSSHGHESSEEYGIAGVYLDGEGFAIAGHTNGYQSSFTDIIVYKTNNKCKLYDNWTFEFIPDTVIVNSVNNINKSAPNINYNTTLNTISFENENITLDFEVYDLSGHFVFNGFMFPDQTMNINSLPISNGVYFFIFTSSSHATKQHLMVVKNSL